jgi:hypothetical protein
MTTPLNRRELLAGLLASAPAAMLALDSLASEAPAASAPAGPAGAKPRVLVTISKETTYITEPLRPDGYPDYLAALNQRCRRGVTPENNAAVLFWKAVGPQPIDQQRRKPYFETLRMARPPETGEYFIDWWDYMTAQTPSAGPGKVTPEAYQESLRDQFDIATRRSWTNKEFPVLARWLSINEEPMAVLVEASRRPRRYDPWFETKDEGGIDIADRTLARWRDTAKAFVVRANRRIREGETTAAWEDILACHRWARLMGQGPLLIEALVAASIEDLAEGGDLAMLQFARLDARQISKMRHDLAELPAVFTVADKLEVGERFFVLDSLLHAARQSSLSRKAMVAKLRELSFIFSVGLGDNETLKPIFESLQSVDVDWDTTFRACNRWYDRSANAGRKPTRAERAKSIAEIGKEVRGMQKAAKLFNLAGLSDRQRQQAVSERLGESLAAIGSSWLLPVIDLADRIAMQPRLIDVAFALAAFRVEKGSYPERLSDLSPKHLATVPKDFFDNDADLHYRREGAGYLLYSVGPNGKDDGGKTREDRYKPGASEGADWDDLVVRMPPEEPKSKPNP